MRVAIIGAGWYGSHIAYVLKKKFGHDVTLFEKNADIFSGISGKFGIRLHAGPHYPRSKETRENCQEGFERFYDTYPALIDEHSHSIYALGDKDADGEAPKVDKQTFEAVCNEFNAIEKIDCESWGYTNLISAVNIKEPSIVIGERLRNQFKQYLQEADVKVVCNFTVTEVNKSDDKFVINAEEKIDAFDRVINTTSFQALLLPEKPLPLGIKVAYQPCVALVYKDKESTALPFSFIVMDGWFPCVMPYGDPIQKDGTLERNYIMTHGKWTLLGSFDTAEEANNCLAAADDVFIETNVKSLCERDMDRFWPSFRTRFEYCGWKGSTLAKVISNGEFRSSITIEQDSIIYVIPGKVSNIFNAESEVLALINNQHIIDNGDGYRYISNGTLDNAMQELREKLVVKNTCMLQPYEGLLKAKESDFQDESRRESISENRNNTSFYTTDTAPHTPSSPRFFGGSPNSSSQGSSRVPSPFVLSNGGKITPIPLSLDDELAPEASCHRM